MAKEKAGAATAAVFIQQATLVDGAQGVVDAVAAELQAESWTIVDGKADISGAMQAAWTKQMNAIGVTDEQSANVVIAASVTLPYATMNATAEQAMKRYLDSNEQQNIKIPIKNISSGIYIAKAKTSTGEITQKIIIP